jgi:hypothetical protein
MFRWFSLLLCLMLLGIGTAGMRQVSEGTGRQEGEDSKAAELSSDESLLESVSFKIFLAGAALMPLSVILFWRHFRRGRRATLTAAVEEGPSAQEAEDEAARILAELDAEERQSTDITREPGASATGEG